MAESELSRKACAEGGFEYDSFTAGATFRTHFVLLRDLRNTGASAQVVVLRHTLETLREVAAEVGYELLPVDIEHDSPDATLVLACPIGSVLE